MRILDRLPYAAEPATVSMRQGIVQVRPYQIIVWMSISVQEVLHWDARLPQVPVILDTGNNHNFAIGRTQLRNWAGIEPEVLEARGTIRERGRLVPLRAATVWLHFNQPGKRETRTDRKPFQLNLREGIAIYPDGQEPRLPVLGLRGLTANHLHLAIDGHRRLVYLRTLDWRARLLRFLS